MKKIIDKFISNEVRGVLSQLDLLVDTLNEHHKIEPVSTEVFVARFAEDTDRLIVDAQKYESLTFVGGHIVVKIVPKDEKTFELALNLYFMDKEGKVILKDFSKKLPCVLLDELSLADLAEKKEIKFEVTEPQLFAPGRY